MSGSGKSARGRAANIRGRRAEMACAAYLVLTGWRVLARRLTGKRGSGIGEIDFVAVRGDTVAMIEVKARDSVEHALCAVGAEQRQRLARAANAFLARRPDLSGKTLRFDVMTVGRFYWPTRHADAWRLDG